MIASRFSHPKFITDEDNPLIDRKYPNEMAADDGVALPQIYRFDFTEVPDFSQTVMQITPVIDASNIMKPSLARGEIQLIGATTIAEYRKYIEKDAALERRFQPV